MDTQLKPPAAQRVRERSWWIFDAVCLSLFPESGSNEHHDFLFIRIWGFPLRWERVASWFFERDLKVFCEVCKREAPLRDGECPDCCH